MFRLRIRDLKDDYGTGKENLTADFLQAIGFLGTDGPRTKETKRANVRNGTSGFNSCWRKDIWYPIQLRQKPSLRQSIGWVIVSPKVEYVGGNGKNWGKKPPLAECSEPLI